MSKTPIAFIGGGNMSRALVSGLAPQGDFEIRVADPGEAARAALDELSDISVYEHNDPAVVGADCIIFAVKPQIMQIACAQIKEYVCAHQPLLISVAAGIECAQIGSWFDGHSRVVRVMPNTPALLGAGASAMFAASGVNDDDRRLAHTIFASVGIAEWLEREDLIDVATALSGSGPAYFFYVLEALEKRAIELGLPQDTARRLARQTATGAALMATHEDGALAPLRERVTSPGGTTEAALKIFADNQMDTIIELGVTTAQQRAKELAAEFGTS